MFNILYLCNIHFNIFNYNNVIIIEYKNFFKIFMRKYLKTNQRFDQLIN